MEQLNVLFYHKSNNKGSALLAVLMLLALATTLLGIFVEYNKKNQISLNTYELNGTILIQVNAVEDFAGNVIKINSINSPEITSLKEDWNQSIQNFAIGPYIVNSQIHDLQSKFNINSLIKSNEDINQINSSSIVNYIQYDRLNRLFRELNVNTDLIDSIIDWIDTDSDTYSSYGAEDDFYLRKVEPYRSANNFLHDIDELNLIKGFNIQIINILRPYLTTLSINDYLNINTISLPILKSLHTLLGPINVEGIIRERKKNSFKNIKDFKFFLKNNLRFEDEVINEITYMLSTSSTNFLLKAEILYSNQHVEFETVLKYKPDIKSIIKRKRIIKDIGTR